MDKLILENVRCFRGRHEIPLAPLTLIVGENSTGKSTLLAAARLAWDLRKGVLQPDFNEEPFDWGAFDQIAHYPGGRGGRAKTFRVGCVHVLRRLPTRVKEEVTSSEMRFQASFGQSRALPEIEMSELELQPYCVTTEHKSGGDSANVVVKKGQRRHSFELKAHSFADVSLRSEIATALLRTDIFSDDNSTPLRLLLLGRLVPQERRPVAIAPVRSKPRRTYDRRSEVPQPEGGHVPMILAALKSSNPKDWQELKESLREFGVESGLFKSIDIKRLGTKDSDPFQVRIKALGPAANLVDVGYGVSQILPVVVDCLTADRGQMLLMQQPEVHLHPRAQAELGTFLGHMVKRRRNRFMIETHSDYLIDRVRLDIRDGKNLRPQDVSLLYCERNKIGVNVHRIEIDSRGNLLNAPPGYRSFFLEEEKRFFGE